MERAAEHYWTGRWDEVVRTADDAVAASTAGPYHVLANQCRWWRGRVRLARGDLDGALDDAERALEQARRSGDPQSLDPALAFAARCLLTAGRPEEADELVSGLLAGLRERLIMPAAGVDLAIDLVALGHAAEELEVALPSRWLDAARAMVAGDARQAADTYAAIGSRPDEAYARLQAARQLLLTGQAAAANAELAVAHAFFRKVDAGAQLAEITQLFTALLAPRPEP